MGKSGLKDTHSVLHWVDGPRRTSGKATSEMFGVLPNDLGEVSGAFTETRFTVVIVLGFTRPHVDPVGDGERTRSNSQVLCKI